MRDVINSPDRLRVAAISFLNPAPLLWNFEHEPHAAELRERYDLQYTLPSRCALQLATGEADLGLIPIASLPSLPEVRAISDCVIASLHNVRSIQLVLRPGVSLEGVESVACDAASRSSAAYVRILLQQYYRCRPAFQEQAPQLEDMLKKSEAALLIGDPALLALEQRENIGRFSNCTWIDVGALWRQHTGLPWVAAVWAVRPGALERCSMSASTLTQDLSDSRTAGQRHTEALVSEWSSRIALPARVIRQYLTENIHYRLDADCLEAIRLFYRLGETAGVLPPYRFQLL